jgi:hypothetical protein
VHGNGGRSSHQRTCEVYHRVQRDSWARNLDAFKAAGRPGHEIRNAQRMLDEHLAALDDIIARQGGPEGDEPSTTPAPVES